MKVGWAARSTLPLIMASPQTTHAQVRMLEGLFGLMVGVMCVSFGAMYVRAGVPIGPVIRGFAIPYLPKEAVPTVRKRERDRFYS